MTYEEMKQILDETMDEGIRDCRTIISRKDDFHVFLSNHPEYSHLINFKFDEMKIIKYLSGVNGLISQHLQTDDHLWSRMLINLVIYKLSSQERQDEYSYLDYVCWYDTLLDTSLTKLYGISDKWKYVANHIRDYLVKYYKSFEDTKPCIEKLEFKLKDNPNKPSQPLYRFDKTLSKLTKEDIDNAINGINECCSKPQFDTRI